MIDNHIHSDFSFDSDANMRDSVNFAIEKGVEFIAFTDHDDKDYLSITNYDIPQIDIDGYFKEAKLLQEEYKDKIKIAVGIECGYSKNAEKIYKKNLSDYRFDVILNSVHTVFGQDCYYDEFFKGKDKDLAYTAYLEAVRQSVDASYDYDIISHFGYVTRSAPYENPAMSYFEYSSIIDDILYAVISKGKCLEVNTRSKEEELYFVPNVDILKRYKELGGDKITFGSDAHKKEDICKNYKQVKHILSELGFSHWTVYIDRKPIKIEF